MTWPAVALRLEAEIPAYELHLNRSMPVNEPEGCKSAKDAVVEAREALRQGHFAEAMIAFDYAKREEILSWTEEEVLRPHVISLFHQSERLSDITRDAIKEILHNKTPSITAAELVSATELKDVDLQDAFFAMQRISRHLSRLSIITFGILMGIAALAKFRSLIDNPTILLGVMCFGALGASVSMMISVAPTTGGPIPSQLATGVLLWARPLFGASAAVAIYVLILMNVLHPGFQPPFVYFGFAFAAGFSDQLLLNAVGKVISPGERLRKTT